MENTNPDGSETDGQKSETVPTIARFRRATIQGKRNKIPGGHMWGVAVMVRAEMVGQRMEIYFVEGAGKFHFVTPILDEGATEGRDANEQGGSEAVDAG